MGRSRRDPLRGAPGMSRRGIKAKFDEIVDFAEVERFWICRLSGIRRGCMYGWRSPLGPPLEPEVLPEISPLNEAC